MFSDLLVEIKILFALHWSKCWVFNGSNPIESPGAPRSDVAQHNHSKWVAMDLRQSLSIHFPYEQDLICFGFGPWNAHDVIHRLVVLEVGLSSIEFEMLSAVFETTTVFDNSLQADAYIICCTYGSLGPWSLWYLVSLSSIKADLLYASSPRALNCDKFLDPRELCLIHEIIQFILLGFRHQTIELKTPLILINIRYATVITNKVKRSWRDSFRSHKPFGRLTIVWELQ